LRTDCQSDLDKVLPLLAAAADALEKITKDDMTTLKSFAKPPDSAAIVIYIYIVLKKFNTIFFKGYGRTLLYFR
jgi:hypothetical protein